MKMITNQPPVVGIFTKDIPYTCSKEVLHKADIFTPCKFAQIGGRTKVVPQQGNIIRGYPIFTDETGTDYIYVTDTIWFYQDIRDIFPNPGYEVAGANLIESIENKTRPFRDNGNRIEWNGVSEDPTGGREETTFYYTKAKVRYFSSAEEMKGGHNNA